MIEGYGTMLVNGKLEDKTIKMEFAKTAYISFTNMTLVSLNKLKKEGYVWDMQEDVLIHQSDQKVCNIEEHYGLATIEYNPVEITNVAVEKITPFLAKVDVSDLKENAPLMAKFLAKVDASDLKENAPLMAKSLAKEDASEENPPIVATDDGPTEEKMDTEQKEDAPTLKKPHTDPVLAAVAAAEAVASGGEVNHQELFGPATPVSDWLKSAPDHPKWMDQKEDLIQSANGLKKRRSLVSKKRCKNLKTAVRCKQAAKTGFSH